MRITARAATALGPVRAEAKKLAQSGDRTRSVLQLMFMPEQKLRVVRAIIFDLDGTLIDSKLDLIHSVNAMLGDMKRPQLAAETISGYIGHGAPQLVARALGGTATDEELKDALQFFLGYYEEHKMDNTCAYPGVPETLAQLSHLPMAVLTNKPERISLRILNFLGLAKYFRVVYGGNSFESKKPDPFGATKILQELGVVAHDALIVGDSEVDVQTARNAGTLAAAVNYGFGVHDRTAHPADIYLDRFTDLTEVVRHHSAV
jgi:phosphoglycolate phosphatase